MKNQGFSSRFLLVTGFLFLFISATLWWSTLTYHQLRVNDLLTTWTQIAAQRVDDLSNSIQAFQDSKTNPSPQKVVDLFIKPVKLLDGGSAWAFEDGHLRYSSGDIFPLSYQGRLINEIFDAQPDASNQKDLVLGALNGGSGSGWYIWSPEQGQILAAWKTIEVLGKRWTIGISLPKSNINEIATEQQEYIRNIVIVAIATLLMIGLYLLLWRQHRQESRQMTVMEESVASRSKELVRSELRYRTLVENLHEGILLYDSATEQTLYSNPASAEIFGKVRKDGVTQPLDVCKLILPEDRLRLLEVLKRQLVDPTPSTGIYQARSVTGSPLWLEIRSTRVEYEGRPVNVMLINNFSDRKRSEAALREGEERYRGIFNSVQDAILLEDHTGRILDVNAGAMSMFGYSRDEFLSRSVHDLCTTESLFVLARSPEELLEKIPNKPVEAVNIRANGQLFPAEITFRPHSLNGSTVALVVVRDITQRKQAEEAVRGAHEKVDRLMVSIPDVLWSGEVDLSGRFWFTYISPVMEKISGYAPQVFLERSDRWLEVVHPDDRDLIKAQMRRFYSNGQPSIELEYRVIKPDGSTRYVRDRQSARITSSGKWIDGVMVDITEQKRFDQQLKKANRDLSLTVKELQVRHREVSLLNEMGDLLQGCVTQEDAYAVIGRFTTQLFPGQSGALYLFGSSDSTAEPAIVWGDKPPSHAAIAAQDCLGLRRGKTHVYAPTGSNLRCAHTSSLNHSNTICTPLIAQGETLGLLHLIGEAQMQERSIQLAETLARQVALALSNLRLRDSLRLQATQDALTGLYNRRYMEDTLTRVVSGKIAARSLGIILLDIDQFKRCNDSFGHDAGDTLLKSFGQYLQSQFGSPCMAFRYGGDEFVVLLPDHELSETLRQAERLRSGFRQMKVYHQGELLHFNTLSLGVAEYPMHGENQVELLRRADAALYQAKSSGGDQVIVVRK